MSIDYSLFAIPKPPPRVREKVKKDRESGKSVKDVRAYCFARERNLCRCCRLRPADSLHEIKPRSLGGKVSRKNSVALCGSGTTGCHGFCQSHGIDIGGSILGAEAELLFTAVTKHAAEWMRIALGEQIESKPMIEMEAAE